MDLAILDTLDSRALRRTRKRLRRLARRAPRKAAAFARRQAEAAAERSAEQIRARPLTAAALLLGAGVAAGALVAAAVRR